MEYDEVKRWVSTYIERGYSPAQVKSYFLQLNYPEDQIDRAINECLQSKQSFGVKNRFQFDLRLLIGIAVIALLAVTVFLYFFVFIKNSKIETAIIPKNNFIIPPGGNSNSYIMLYGEGEAKISIKNLSQWISIPSSVELSSTPKNISFSISVPSGVDSGKYFGSIVISTTENTKELPLTFVINNPPVLSSVTLSSDSVGNDGYINFTAIATDMNNENLRILVCEDSACNNEWCNNTGTFCSAQISNDETVGEKDYYVKVCDDLSCSSIKSGTFNVTNYPTGHIYLDYDSVCEGCRNLAYDLIEDVVGVGAPHYGVELKLWTDESNDTINPYVAKRYDDFASNHLEETKSDWINLGVPESSFPRPFSTWTSENVDILNSSGSYICVCSKTFNCYCDDLMGIQPPPNGCIDTNPGCSHETYQCAQGTCTEMLEPQVYSVLESFGI